jgi:hypothetical protein
MQKDNLVDILWKTVTEAPRSLVISRNKNLWWNANGLRI